MNTYTILIQTIPGVITKVKVDAAYARAALAKALETAPADVKKVQLIGEQIPSERRQAVQ